MTLTEPLDPSHDMAQFDCGSEALNVWLRRFALQNEAAGASRTRVAVEGVQVVGFYALAAGAVEPARAPRRVTRGLARHPVPVIVLTRLAVDRTRQGTGLGARLLRDALLRIAGAADIIGTRAVLVHAKGEAARAFYLRYGFEQSPTDPLQLMLLMKDLRASLKER